MNIKPLQYPADVERERLKNKMREAMSRSGVMHVPVNRKERRRINKRLREVGAPELQFQHRPKSPG